MANKLRVGIIGLGNVGMVHFGTLTENGGLSQAELTAVCDRPGRIEEVRQMLPTGTKVFENYDVLLESRVCDAVIVATPHYQHPELSIKALQAGLHVFCEKPAGVSIGPVRKMLAEAKKSDRILTFNLCRRMEPVYQKMRDLIANGELGKIDRINYTATKWYRPDCYFNSAAWRATWSGEGGGVLINQCIHDLDVWQYLFGLPERVRSFCRFGKHHDIEVEDEVTAFLDYGEQGISGVFTASTGESPGTNRVEIACSRGRLIMEDRRLIFNRTEIPIPEHNRLCDSGFSEPAKWDCEIPVDGKFDPAQGLLRNFVEAVTDSAPLLISAQEGAPSMEIENAILLSEWLDDWARLPVRAELFGAEMEKRINASIGRDKLDGEEIGKRFNLHDSFR